MAYKNYCLMAYHKENGHRFGRKWSALRLPVEIVDFIREKSGGSPANYLEQLLISQGYDNKKNQFTDDKQLTLF